MVQFIVGAGSYCVVLEVCFRVYVTIFCGEASFKLSLSKVPSFGIFTVFLWVVLCDIF